MSDESKKRVLTNIRDYARKMKGEELVSRMGKKTPMEATPEVPNEDPAHEASESPEVEAKEESTGLEALDEGKAEVPGEVEGVEAESDAPLAPDELQAVRDLIARMK
jgi:hypothetical protein